MSQIVFFRRKQSEEELHSGENKLLNAAFGKNKNNSVAGQFDVLVSCSSHRCACN